MAEIAQVKELKPDATDSGMPQFKGIYNAIRIMGKARYDRIHLEDWKDEKILKDGSVVLGSGQPNKAAYTTRYVIQHPEDKHHICEKVMYSQCAPCHNKSLQKSWCYILWLILRSETFLYFMHCAALALGVLKAALQTNITNDTPLIIYSVCESFATYVVLSVRLALTWERYTELRDAAFALEYVDHNIDARLMSLYLWVRGIIGTGIALTLISGGLYVMFFFVRMNDDTPRQYPGIVWRELEWTLLTNQFLLLLFMTVCQMFLCYKNKLAARIRADQHKCVLYEAVSLLGETNIDIPLDGVRNTSKVKQFIQALYDTPMFNPPPRRIKLNERYRQDIEDLYSNLTTDTTYP